MRNLSVVVPSRNVSNLNTCVRAIRECEPDISVVVVDDGLGPAWNPRPDQFQGATVKGMSPFVFSRNVNIGIQAAGDDDIVILGDDGILMTPFGFTLLQKAADANPEFGIISATTNLAGNRNQYPQQETGLREEPRMVCFIAVLIPRTTIDSVGLLDEEFIGYGFDDDSYCVRVRRAGLKIGILDDTFVDHTSLPSTFRSLEYPGPGFHHNAEVFRRKYGADHGSV